MKQKGYYTHHEELWNAWSHAGGIALGVVCGAIFLDYCVRAESFWGVISICIYLFGMLGSYISSTVYHALPPHSQWKGRTRKLDHAAIYWHIAGSYAPLTLLALRHEGYWGYGLFGFVWLFAAIGTIASFYKLKDHSNLETIIYVGMGLSVLVAFKPLLHAVDISIVLWIIAEGVMYITGALFYSLHKRKYMHTIFHFFVLAGSACHLTAVWKIITHMA